MSLTYVSGAAAQAPFYRRYTPDTGITLAVLDALCLLGWHLLVLTQTGWYGRAQLPHDIALTLSLQIAPQIALLYVFGSFRREMMVNTPLALIRLPTIAGFAGVVTFVLAQPFIPSAGSAAGAVGSALFALISTGVSLWALVWSRCVFHLLMRKKLFSRRILVVGTGRKALYLQELMSGTIYRPTATLLSVPEALLGQPLSGEAEPDGGPDESRDHRSLLSIAHTLEAAEIVVALDDMSNWPMENLLASKLAGIRVTDYSAFIERETGRVDLDWLDIRSLIYSNGFQAFVLNDMFKRAIDVVVCLAAGFLVLPVMLAAVIAIYLETGRPIFYRQERVTLHGRRFMLFKLRTMRQDAEKNGPQWADQKDRRITRVGSFLRRTRIDEIPQLLNVIRGEMSLVGPRPERPIFTEQFSQSIPFYEFRHSVRAGLTGWAQINFPYGASAEDARKKLEYDLYYIKNYSPWRDFIIMLQTVRILVWQEGVR